MNLRARIGCLLFFAALALPAYGGDAPTATITTQIVSEKSGPKPVTLQLEIAKTPAAREHGLMNRERIQSSDGMAFWFPTIQPQVFWMKDTPLPLDIIFVDGTGRIIRIAQGAPYSEAPIASGGAIETVIELDAGRAAKDGIAIGDKVAYDIQVPPSHLAR